MRTPISRLDETKPPPMRLVTSVRGASTRWLPNTNWAILSVPRTVKPSTVIAEGTFRFALYHYKSELRTSEQQYTNPTWGEAWAEFRRMNTKYVADTKHETTHVFFETITVEEGGLLMFGAGS
jgi:hypothetical protein